MLHLKQISLLNKQIDCINKHFSYYNSSMLNEDIVNMNHNFFLFRSDPQDKNKQQLLYVK